MLYNGISKKKKTFVVVDLPNGWCPSLLLKLTWCKINGIIFKDFIDNPENKGLLPVRGTIPDMFSDSERYIKLLNIYRNKAIMDAEQVYRRVQTHLESIGRSPVSTSQSNRKSTGFMVNSLKVFIEYSMVHNIIKFC